MLDIQQDFYQIRGKRFIDLLISTACIFLLWPLVLLIGFLASLDSPGPVIFRQKRVGKDGKVFLIYKFRTMVKEAEELKENYKKFNEADGPVFKIRDDPRFTRTGKLLANTGLDELPQIINVIKGEMSFVGPRPLPIDEAKKIDISTKKRREKVLPGITSQWVVSGSHQLTFKEWMKMDNRYIENINFVDDLAILASTSKIIIRSFFRLFI